MPEEQCTLRAAIQEANAEPGADRVEFALPSPNMIALTAPLPAIVSALQIDGRTQPGFAGSPLVVISGLGTAGDGLQFVSGSDGSEVRGLELRDFVAPDRSVGAIALRDCQQVTVAGNYLGPITGGGFYSNWAGVLVAGSRNVIGGSTVQDRNVISGNNVGIEFAETAADNLVQGNYIGTDASGSTSQPHWGNYWDNVVIEGGGGQRIDANVISGSAFHGLLIESDGNVLTGNRIGTDAAGATAQPNLGTGIAIVGSSNRIGGPSPADRNVVSGNEIGILVRGNDNVIQGNFVGLDVSGTASLGNGVGIFVSYSTGDESGNVVGGDDPNQGNVISGNRGPGVTANARETEVRGNRIGTDSTGRVGVPNTDGIVVGYWPGIVIAGNVVSGNNAGIRLDGGPLSGTEGTTIVANQIGVGVDGAPLRNTRHGIYSTSLAAVHDCRIGGVLPAEGNVIAFNGGAGISLAANAGTIRNRIRGNAIHDNGQPVRDGSGIGIDLNADGVTTNDPLDADGRANDSQNYPVIASVRPSGLHGVLVEGTLHSLPATSFALDFFGNSTVDPSGFGEGEIFLGTTDTVTDAEGNATFRARLVMASPAAAFITATATVTSGASAGDSSEFSGAVAAAVGDIPTLAAAPLVLLTLLLAGVAMLTLRWLRP